MVASVGDSRAMLCRKGRAAKLSKDHTPDREDERRRYTISDRHSTSAALRLHQELHGAFKVHLNKNRVTA